jgi:rhodanese-related sulfurtransferase
MMKKRHWLGMIVLCALALAMMGCSSSKQNGTEKSPPNKPPAAATASDATDSGAQKEQTKPAAVTDLTPEQLRKMIADKEDMIIVDVRQPEELKTELAPLDKAVNIPLPDLRNRLGELPLEKKIVLVCRSGHRSGIAADLLVKSGYTQVYSLAGGMKAYRESEKK